MKLLTTVGTLLFASKAFAQDLPTPENPLPVNPFDLLDMLELVVTNFQMYWYLGTAVVLFALVAFLRGKLKMGNIVIRIPKLSDWLDGSGNKVKFYLIIGMTGVGSGLAALGTIAGPWTFWLVTKAFLGGLTAGVSLAFTAMGVKKGVDVHLPNKPVKLEIGKKVSLDGKLYNVEENGTLVEIKKG